MPRFYNEGQVKRIFPYCKGVDCFILGGPADGNEAQAFHNQYPNVKIIGVEPNSVMYEFQIDNQFPDTLLYAALSSQEGTAKFVIPREDNRCGSIVNYEGEGTEINTVTLDGLVKKHGPYRRIALWLDVEGAELDCLKGAHEILNNHHVRVANIEVTTTTRESIVNYMLEYGYVVALEDDVRHMGKGRIISDLVFVTQLHLKVLHALSKNRNLYNRSQRN